MKEYSFKGCLKRLSQDACGFIVAWVPDPIMNEVDPAKTGTRRIVMTVRGRKFRCALQPGGGKKYYLLFSKRLRKEVEAEIGDELEISFRLDDPKHVEIPEELAAVLEKSRAARTEWQKLTPGKQRGYAHMVASAKQKTTRARRAEKVIDLLLPLRLDCIPTSRKRDRNH